jgi:probable phosphoglycerate mutase
MSDSRRIVLLRHGRTAWNAERRFQGQANPPLDDVGRRQAYEVAPLIAALRPDVLISSDADRAAQTAEPIGAVTGLEVVLDARLRERALGHWEGLTRGEVQERYPEEFAAWIAGKDVSQFGRGGESREDVAARAIGVFEELPDVETAVLVTHGATSMALAAAILGLSQNVHSLGPLANCHWSELVVEYHVAPSAAAEKVVWSGEPGEAIWRLRAHNVGIPGVVVPLPLQPEDEIDDASDAEA